MKILKLRGLITLLNLKVHASFIYTITLMQYKKGRGIYLTKKVESFSYSDHCVIQEYLKNPFLIDGLKFDFRIYVLIKNINPLKIFMYPEGLARFATVKYSKPNKKNCQNFTMHLTNYAVNKKSPNFVFNENENNDDIGHKRSFSSILKQLHNMGKDIPKLYMEIRQLIVKTVISVQPQLSHIYRSSQPKEYQNEMCFEVLGFDVMIDDKMKPWLLEVNHSASFHCDSPLDMSIKKNVILDTLNIINISSKEKKKYLEQKSQAQFAYRKKEQVKSSSEKSEKEQIQIDQQKIIKYENKHKGAFLRIYPTEDDPEDYKNILKISNQIWNDTISPKKNQIAQIQQISSSATAPKSDLRNLKSTPIKKTSINESISIINTTQISYANSESKSKVSNYSSRKNHSQVLNEREKSLDTILNFLPNVQSKENANSGSNSGRNRTRMLLEQTIDVTFVPMQNYEKERNNTTESNQILSLKNNNYDENNEKVNGNDDEEDILSSILGKKRSMTQLSQNSKAKQNLSKSQLARIPSFQASSIQQQSTSQFEQAFTQEIAPEISRVITENNYDSINVYSNQQKLQMMQQDPIIKPQTNNIQHSQSVHKQPQYRNNNINLKKYAQSEDEILIKAKGNSLHEQGYNISHTTQHSEQQSSLDQIKLNIINLGINKPDMVAYDQWQSQTQKPLYLRVSPRKSYKTSLKPLSSDFQSILQRDNRNSNTSKIAQHSIQNDSLLTSLPKYLPPRRNNISVKYSNNLNQQNIDHYKQIDNKLSDQSKQRSNSNFVASKGHRSESYQNSLQSNSQINETNFPSVQQQSQPSTQQFNQNNNNVNNQSVNVFNSQLLFSLNNNIKNMIGVNQEVQMSYAKRRIVRKSFERKQIKDIIQNESLAGNYKAVDQKQQAQNQEQQTQNSSYGRNKTIDSMDYNNFNNNSLQNNETIGGFSRGITNINTNPSTILHSPQKHEEYSNILNLRNLEQPLYLSPNLIAYQQSQLQKNNGSLSTQQTISSSNSYQQKIFNNDNKIQQKNNPNTNNNSNIIQYSNKYQPYSKK